MKDLGLMCKFLGIQVHQTNHGILLYQLDNITSIVKKFINLANKPSYIPLALTFQLQKNTHTPSIDE
jgi:hypothetical protein